MWGRKFNKQNMDETIKSMNESRQASNERRSNLMAKAMESMKNEPDTSPTRRLNLFKKYELKNKCEGAYIKRSEEDEVYQSRLDLEGIDERQLLNIPEEIAGYYISLYGQHYDSLPLESWLANKPSDLDIESFKKHKAVTKILEEIYSEDKIITKLINVVKDLGWSVVQEIEYFSLEKPTTSGLINGIAFRVPDSRAFTRKIREYATYFDVERMVNTWQSNPEIKESLSFSDLCNAAEECVKMFEDLADALEANGLDDINLIVEWYD